MIVLIFLAIIFDLIALALKDQKAANFMLSLAIYMVIELLFLHLYAQ